MVIPATRSTPGEPWGVNRRPQRGRGLPGLVAVGAPPPPAPRSASESSPLLAPGFVAWRPRVRRWTPSCIRGRQPVSWCGEEDDHNFAEGYFKNSGWWFKWIKNWPKTVQAVLFLALLSPRHHVLTQWAQKKGPKKETHKKGPTKWPKSASSVYISPFQGSHWVF